MLYIIFQYGWELILIHQILIGFEATLCSAFINSYVSIFLKLKMSILKLKFLKKFNLTWISWSKSSESQKPDSPTDPRCQFNHKILKILGYSPFHGNAP